MSKINLRFIWNKLFLGGLFTGIVLSAIVFFVVFSSNFPPAAKQKLTGTMSTEVYVPSVGESGVVVSCGNYCNEIYCDATFDNDPNHNVIRCHLGINCPQNSPVAVVSVSNGEFCQGGGVHLSLIPEQL